MNFPKNMKRGLVSPSLRVAAGVSSSLAERGSRARGFTLLEVMIALGIFFTCIFSILALVSMNLRNARLLQQARPDAGVVFADAAQRDRLEDGEGDGDFAEAFPGYKYKVSTNRIKTNGTFEVNVVIINPAGGTDSSSARFWRPNSPHAMDPL